MAVWEGGKDKRGWGVGGVPIPPNPSGIAQTNGKGGGGDDGGKFPSLKGPPSK